MGICREELRIVCEEDNGVKTGKHNLLKIKEVSV